MRAYIDSREIDQNNKYGQSVAKLRSEWVMHREDRTDLNEYLDLYITSDLLPLINNEAIEKEVVEAQRPRRGGNATRSRDQTRPLNSRERAKHAYARCQELFKKCSKKLAEYTVKGDFSFAESRQALPDKDDIERTYGSMWGRSGPEHITLPEQEVEQKRLCMVAQPISLKEIKFRINKTKSGSAAGADGVKKVHIARAGVGELLEVLYNILLLEGIYPESWKFNRTTLIPKAGKDLTDVKNWRPITVGSLLARIYSALIDAMLRKFVEQSHRQKGFTSEGGCSQNIIILEQAIEEMNTRGGGIMSVLDISKAFDSVPHSVINPGLRRKGVPDQLISIVNEMYRGCKTVIKGSNGVISITLKRGVKQGDPLSPLIFNLAIEPFLNKLCFSAHRQRARGAESVQPTQVTTRSFVVFLCSE